MNKSSYGEAIKQPKRCDRASRSPSPASAQIDLIYAYYKNHETDPAIDAADTFIRENPTNPRVDYAYYMKGLVYFERQANFLERWFNVDLRAGRLDAKKSFDAFDELLKRYPHSQYAGDAQRMIFLRNRLADFELYVAEYYMRRGAYVGALNRAKFCIKNYNGTRRPPSRYRQAYHDLGMNDLAADAERVYNDNYPASSKDVEKKKSWWRRILSSPDRFSSPDR